MLIISTVLLHFIRIYPKEGKMKAPLFLLRYLAGRIETHRAWMEYAKACKSRGKKIDKKVKEELYSYPGTSFNTFLELWELRMYDQVSNQHERAKEKKALLNKLYIFSKDADQIEKALHLIQTDSDISSGWKWEILRSAILDADRTEMMIPIFEYIENKETQLHLLRKSHRLAKTFSDYFGVYQVASANVVLETNAECMAIAENAYLKACELASGVDELNQVIEEEAEAISKEAVDAKEKACAQLLEEEEVMPDDCQLVFEQSNKYQSEAISMAVKLTGCFELIMWFIKEYEPKTDADPGVVKQLLDRAVNLADDYLQWAKLARTNAFWLESGMMNQIISGMMSNARSPNHFEYACEFENAHLIKDQQMRVEALRHLATRDYPI